MSDLNMSHGKMSGFVSFPFFGFTLFIKLRNFDFGSHWNILIFSDQEMMSDLNMLSQKMSELVQVLLFAFNVGNEFINKNFRLYWNNLIFFT